MTGWVLSIDQGTTSTRAIVFNDEFEIAGAGQREFPQHFPHEGWVEHDPEDLWSTTVETCREALSSANITASEIIAVGITNQRETTLIWDRKTGEPVYKAIVWQDRRTSAFCSALKAAGHEETITRKTGLLLDPYFSGTKVSWILDNVEGVRARAEAGDLAFGTVDTWLIWRLTGGKSHVTDATNASRTLLYNIAENCWDEELLALLNIPASLLPDVKDCADDFGMITADLFGAELPIYGVAGDQQAAAMGQACFKQGMVKSTYGTGCFALLNTGEELVYSRNRLLSTIAYRLNGKTTYALEGSIFIAGAAVQWLRDGLKIIDNAAQTQLMAENADPESHVYLVPAFVGLGAPYWDPEARAAIFGMTRSTGRDEIARAALESVGYQTVDLINSKSSDMGSPLTGDTVLRVDGGMVASDWTMQFLADILGRPVDRPVVQETTALGVAWLAGMKAGVWPDMDEFSKRWHLDARFEPQMGEEERNKRLSGWHDAVSRTRSQVS
ncbi:glycerol kinase GlpK [Pseudovibrio sp. Tun.PSC04-5.I4]|uniref:glycerol kinase GlpK n=1 Tax=Pseudovibrio sp. Tun.PSC04-5.I4 TaxID=1798213 RepID=UPI00088132B3|nr:glycerol kinase GlpK [Pseudovibrio sp. Tun.PSC04-5.I4]SDR33256.1 glycerol kinase [Pseudovibrio sp. Tun.PSC04-5.I4]